MLNVKDATSQFIARGADLTRYFTFGDYIVAKIVNVTSQKLVDLTMKGQGLRKLYGGRIVKVSPSKVPRIVGKSGSMVNIIKQATGCRIIVGQNGLFGLKENLKMNLLQLMQSNKIETESHVSGLTERIEAFLEVKSQKVAFETIQIIMMMKKVHQVNIKKVSHMSKYKRKGRGLDETRPIEAKAGVIPNADGSAYFKIGNTVAYAAVYGPKNLFPKFMQNPEKGVLRCHYNMMPFSGQGNRVRPGGNRRAKEISMVTRNALITSCEFRRISKCCS
jgi:polyribonucleotide nucleotidyltransferase